MSPTSTSAERARNVLLVAVAGAVTLALVLLVLTGRRTEPELKTSVVVLKQQRQVVKYTQAGCIPCARLDKKLEEKGIKVIECDINASATCLKEFNHFGDVGTPRVIVEAQAPTPDATNAWVFDPADPDNIVACAEEEFPEIPADDTCKGAKLVKLGKFEPFPDPEEEEETE